MIHIAASTESMTTTAATNQPTPQEADGKKQGEKRSGSPLEEPSTSRTRLNTDETVTVKDENLPYMRELRKNYINHKKAERQIEHLLNCTYKSNIPKTLLPKITPQTPTKPINLQLRWQRVIINAGKEFLDTLIDYWNKHLKTIEEDITSITTELNKNVQPAEIELITKICKEAVAKYLANVDRNAKKKDNKEIRQSKQGNQQQ